MDPDLVVVGSINHDLTVVTARHPAPGETVLGTRHYSGGGGKGANQALAAARLGANVAMVGRVGDDEHGRTLVGALLDEGVDVSAVGVDEEAPTGLAIITIDQHAENTIVVSPGANMRLLPAHLDEGMITNAPVVLAQLEVPLDTVTEAVRLATGIFILNPAPGGPLPEELLAMVDILVPNRPELALLTGGDEPRTIAEVEHAARSIGHSADVVVTLGAEGALLVGDDRSTLVPAPEVSSVDPTGAGDAFCAALARGVSAGKDLLAAVETAVAAGALATTRRGAQAAMPTAEEVEALLRRGS
ncbi:MAG TPA: ribokinase [Acidimicrobiia bacterium]